MDTQNRTSDEQSRLNPELEGFAEDEFIIGSDQSPIGRYVAVITSPVKAFTGLLRATNKAAIIAIGVVISIVCFVGSQAIMSSSVEVMEDIKHQQIEQLDKMYDKGKINKKMYDDGIERAENFDQSSYMIQIGIGSVLYPIIMLLFVLLVYGIARVLEHQHDDGMNFTAVWSMMCISSVVTLIAMMVKAIGAAATGKMSFSLGLGMAIESDNLIVSFLTGIVEPFTIWSLIVTGIGISVLTRVSKGKGILVWSAVFILGGAMLAGFGQWIRGMFMGG